MKIKLGRLEEKASWIGDYDNPDRYELVWNEVDVTEEELVLLIHEGNSIKVNC